MKKAVDSIFSGDQVAYAQCKIDAFCDLNGDKPANPSSERYLDMNPLAVKPEELRNEVLMPVQKK